MKGTIVEKYTRQEIVKKVGRRLLEKRAGEEKSSGHQ